MRFWDSFWCQVLYLKMKMLRLLLPRCSEWKQLSKLQKKKTLDNMHQSTCSVRQGRAVVGLLASWIQRRTLGSRAVVFGWRMVAPNETSKRRTVVTAAVFFRRQALLRSRRAVLGRVWVVSSLGKHTVVVKNPSTYQRNPTEAVPVLMFFTLDLRRQEGKGFETQPDKDDFLGLNLHIENQHTSHY